jgi:glycosyltransferase involved in cell wall biosynthesis
MKLLFDCMSNVANSGYGGAYQNFMLCLLRRGCDLVGMDEAERGDVHLYLGQPDRRWQNTWQRRADVFGLYTMFESEILPAHWVEDVNGTFDFLIVPSNWCRDVFIGGGIQIPIRVVPLGVDPNVFPYLNRPERKMFTILWQGFHQHDRKGYALVDRAFEELNLPNSRLVKKITPFSSQSLVQWEFRTDRWSICRNMTRAELLLLLREADLSVNPTAGEGFGLIPLEHMATGLPTMVSKNSGCLDYCHVNYNIGIECKGGKSWFGPEYGEMQVPDFDDLKAKMKWAYENRRGIQVIGAAGSEWVHSEWTYEKATDKLVEAIHEFVS